MIIYKAENKTNEKCYIGQTVRSLKKRKKEHINDAHRCKNINNQLGENTADNGGMGVAYMALQRALAGQESKPIDGFTPEQRFFLGYANIWCQNVTEQAARQLAQTDPHSAGEFRVNGAVSNMPEFWESFSCKKGQPMVRESACRAW